MQHDGVVQPGGVIQYLLPVAVFAVIFALRARRMTRARPLSPGQLWVLPALLAVMAAAAFWATPPVGSGWLVAAVALMLGAALGWARGKAMRIEVDPETGTLRQRASPVAVLFLMGLVIARSTMRYEGRAVHMDVATTTDALLALAVGTFAVMRLEMHLRAKRLLAEHQRAVFS